MDEPGHAACSRSLLPDVGLRSCKGVRVTFTRLVSEHDTRCRHSPLRSSGLVQGPAPRPSNPKPHVAPSTSEGEPHRRWQYACQPPRGSDTHELHLSNQRRGDVHEPAGTADDEYGRSPCSEGPRSNRCGRRHTTVDPLDALAMVEVAGSNPVIRSHTDPALRGRVFVSGGLSSRGGGRPVVARRRRLTMARTGGADVDGSPLDRLPEIVPVGVVVLDDQLELVATDPAEPG